VPLPSLAVLATARNVLFQVAIVNDKIRGLPVILEPVTVSGKDAVIWLVMFEN
jgi:hypothetical protein